MSTRATPYLRALRGACCLLGLSACESMLGLNQFSVTQPASTVAGRTCSTQRECASSDGQLRCRQARCVSVQREECSVASGPDSDDHAIWIGALLSTSGSDGARNQSRRDSAVLAVEGINAAGGVPFDVARTDLRPLVLVVCDPSRDANATAEYLIGQLGIRALLGPDETQDATLLASKVAIPDDALLVSPFTSTAGFADLLDDGLGWSLSPSDTERAPLLIHQLRALEDTLRVQRAPAELTLAIALRDDAHGQSARACLNGLTFDAKPLTDPSNLGNHVRIDAYASDPSALVERYLELAPDIVVLLGGTEVIAQIIVPLEARWKPDAPRPRYLLTDRAKVAELADLASQSPELATRIRGVGVAPAAIARDSFAAFEAAYRARFAGQRSTLSGLAAIYDATYALAFALAAEQRAPSSGRLWAAGLRALSNAAGTAELRAEQLGTLFDRTLSGDMPQLIGSLGPLRWDERGAAVGGALEVWCLGARESRTDFVSSGIGLLVGETRPSGTAVACEPEGLPNPQRPATGGAAIRSGEAMTTPPADAPSGSAGAPAQVGDPADAGQMPAPDAGSAPEEPPGAIPCGPSSCDSQRDEYCCVAAVRGPSQDPLPTDFSCQRSAGTCAIALHCTSDTDCKQSEVCCGMGSRTGCVSEASCRETAGTRFSCESARDCTPGLFCCAHLTPGTTTYSKVSCETSCSLTDNAVVLCRSDADCDAANVLGSCRPSRIVPNLGVCVLF